MKSYARYTTPTSYFSFRLRYINIFSLRSIHGRKCKVFRQSPNDFVFYMVPFDI